MFRVFGWQMSKLQEENLDRVLGGEELFVLHGIAYRTRRGWSEFVAVLVLVIRWVNLSLSSCYKELSLCTCQPSHSSSNFSQERTQPPNHIPGVSRKPVKNLALHLQFLVLISPWCFKTQQLGTNSPLSVESFWWLFLCLHLTISTLAWKMSDWVTCNLTAVYLFWWAVWAQ